jgi:Ca2+-binding RTX toxin-like protein
VSDNEAAFGSGAIFLSAPAFIDSSTFTENRLEGETGEHNGGAIATTANFSMRNSTVAGNTADQGGGGIVAYSGADVNLTNVTVTDNTADLNQDTAHPADGGGIYSENGGLFRIRNTVISGNHDLTPQGDGDISPNCAAQVTLAGNNLLGDTEGCATQKLNNTPAEIPDGTNPHLGELAMNGGPTATVSFAKASPLRDRIKASKCDDGGISKVPEITEDQRGVPRPQKGRCDVGAYERATCKGVLVNRVGTGAGDRLEGAQSDNGLLGLGGKDKLKGKDGKDGLCGAEGKDELAGGAGGDRLVGGPGADTLVGGPGFDVCVGGPGKDVAIDCEEVKGV